MTRIAIVVALFLAAIANASETTSPAQKYFTDVQLVDQHGKHVRFYTDVLKGKIVVVASFYADCTSVCPVMHSTLNKLQTAFGDRMGRDVFLVSITVNAPYDTPERLANYAKHVGAGRGWVFLTGTKENVQQALYKLGFATDTPESHKNLFIVGNEPTGLWKKVFGLAKPDEIIQVVDGVSHNR